MGLPSPPMMRMQQSRLATTGSQSPTPGSGMSWGMEERRPQKAQDEQI